MSIPVDVTSDPELAKLEEKGVKGHYVSVESIKELPSGKTEWRMATSSSPGGHIPAFIAERTMPSSIAAVSTSISLYETTILIGRMVSGRVSFHSVVQDRQKCYQY
jgi:Protein of unknown function (DUF3074)